MKCQFKCAIVGLLTTVLLTYIVTLKKAAVCVTLRSTDIALVSHEGYLLFEKAPRLFLPSLYQFNQNWPDPKWKYGIVIWYLDDPARFWFADYNDDFCRYDENELAGKHIKTFFIKAYVPIGMVVFFMIFVAVICKRFFRIGNRNTVAEQVVALDG